MQFVKNRQGGNLLIHEGYTYKKNLQRGDKTYWICSKYDTEHCRGRCKSFEGVVEVTNKNHNHTVDPSEVEMRKRLAEVREQALTTQDLPCQIIAQAVTNASRSVAAKLPTSALLTRAINNTRKVKTAAPANPNSLVNVMVPESYTVSNSGEPFLLANIGEAERILIFSTTSNLERLGNADLWHGDGTFKCVPGIFTQLYTIHAVKDNVTYPCVYALLPNKREETYNRLLENLKTLAAARNIALTPREIMTDFEIGFMNATKKHFPETIQKGCYFHFSQCLWRKIQENPDIARKYKDDDDFALDLRQVPALAFVPVKDVTASFKSLMKTPFFMTNSELLTPFMDYFEDVWIGRPLRGGNRRQPLFAHDVWNTFTSTTDGKKFELT